MTQDLCKHCNQPLTEKSINKAHGVASDGEGNTWHLDPCLYEDENKD